MAKIPINTKIKTLIYTLEDPDTNEIRYIGKTVKSLSNRLTHHIYCCKRENNHRTNWIKSILKRCKKPIIKMIDFCPWDESQKLEMFWISKFKEQGFNLVNMSDGGEGNIGLKLKPEVIEAIRRRASKKVYQYDLEGDYICYFNSCQDAANMLGINSNSKIAACARGERRSCKNFQWSYFKTDKIDKIKPNKQIGKKLTKEHRDMAIKNLKGYGKDFR